MNVQQMIATHPDVRGNVSAPLATCIEECVGCAQTCSACADACLAEPMVEKLRQCIRLDLDCADLCTATAALASRRTGSNEQILLATIDVCRIACATCAAECERHAAHHEHCRICSEACRRCEDACRAALQAGGTDSAREPSERH